MTAAPAVPTVPAGELASHFLPVAGGQLFLARWRPAPGTKARGAVLLVPPFAEEMNKSRRMLALLGRRLAGRGLEAVLPDLWGSGDSDGEFSDARLSRWQQDLDDVATSLAAQGLPVVAVVGLRFGGLLAVELQRRLPTVTRLVLWQPQPSGAQVLAQFLRLRMAGSLLKSGGTGETVATLQGELRRGSSLDVAGYTLSPGLAADLDGLALTAPRAPCRVDWLEVGTADTPVLSRAAAVALEQWRAAGCEATGAACRGDTFWTTVETTTAPALLGHTEAALEPLWTQ